MMRLTPRESLLALLTLATALGAVTWWLGGTKLERWNEIGRQMEMLEQRRQVAERLVRRRAEVEGRLDELLRALPRYPADRDVTADVLKLIEVTATESGLILTRREPERERVAGELYEVAINCNWEGSLEALTRFLYAIQTKGAVLDVRQLNITSPKSTSSSLSGTFTIACAYTRAGRPGGTTPSPATRPGPASGALARPRTVPFST